MTIGSELDAALAAAQQPGPQGPAGPAGPQGPQGVPGTTPDLTLINSEIAALQAAVAVLQGQTPPPANRPPVWTTVPSIVFTQGVSGTISVASYATDPDGNPLTITLNTSVPLQAGVSFDSPNKRFVYDGVGAAAVTTGHILTADDGK